MRRGVDGRSGTHGNLPVNGSTARPGPLPDYVYRRAPTAPGGLVGSRTRVQKASTATRLRAYPVCVRQRGTTGEPGGLHQPRIAVARYWHCSRVLTPGGILEILTRQTPNQAARRLSETALPLATSAARIERYGRPLHEVVIHAPCRNRFKPEWPSLRPVTGASCRPPVWRCPVWLRRASVNPPTRTRAMHPRAGAGSPEL